MNKELIKFMNSVNNAISILDEFYLNQVSFNKDWNEYSTTIRFNNSLCIRISITIDDLQKAPNEIITDYIKETIRREMYNFNTIIL